MRPEETSSVSLFLANRPCACDVHSVAGTNKPNPWYVGVLVLACGAIAFDRFVVGAEAGVVDDPADEGVLGTEGGVAAASAQDRPREPLGERFALVASRLDPPVQRRLDGFESIAQTPLADDVSSEEQVERVGFATRHRLTAVLNQSGGDLAVVDGKLLHLGDVVEGAELVSINPDGVVFQADGEFIELAIIRPGFDR